MAERQTAARPGAAATGAAARALAARLEERGYRISFSPGRDPAVFRVTGLPGGPDVEVTAEDDGRAACHHTGRTAAEAASVIARLPVPGHSPVQGDAGETVTAVWDGVEVGWHFQPPSWQRGEPGQIAVALLAHLAVLAGGPGGDDAALAAGADGAGRG